MSSDTIFGFTPSPLSAAAIASQALAARRREGAGPALVITPNIDHVARLRHDRAFAEAYRGAALLTCDGWPVALYARLRGLKARRVTGYEIAARLMRAETIAPWHRLYFVVDSGATADAIHRWAARRGLDGQVATCVPPRGFVNDPMFCTTLAEAIRGHRTSILLMGVGAPQSEIFVHRSRAQLPPCWAFCVGQAVMVEAGIIRRAPPALRPLGLEWAWRLAHEPRRLARRYSTAAIGFLLAIGADLMARPGQDDLTPRRSLP